MKLIEIAPSVLSANPAHYEASLQMISNADALHIDIMDGHFVPNMTFGPWMVELAKKYYSGIRDVHIMVDDPEKIAPLYLACKCDCLSFHIETTSNPSKLIASIQKAGAKAGLAINPKTPLSTLYPYLSQVDYVLIMSVQAGFGGQPFQPEAIERVRLLSNELKNQQSNAFISVDGGINLLNIAELAQAGASRFVAGSSVFNNSSPERAIIELKNAAKGKFV